MACGSPNSPPEFRKTSVEEECQESCTAYGLRLPKKTPLKEDQFVIDSNGQMCIKENDGSNCTTVINVYRQSLSRY